MVNFVYPQKGDLVFIKSLQLKGIVHEVVGNRVIVYNQQLKFTEILISDIIVVTDNQKGKNSKEVVEEVEKSEYEMVQEFHKAFNHPISDTPTLIDAERALNRTIWAGEELIEYLHASSKDKEQFAKLYYGFLEGLQVAYKKSLTTEFIQDDVERIVAQADALTDASYFINGTFVEMGVEPKPLFEIVQAANMSKLFTDENGNKYAKYRDDGKILKSPEFFPPEKKLKEEVLRQMNSQSN